MNSETDPTSMTQRSTLTVGELGEQLVAEWLQAQNWVVLHHRWHCRWGEIDLIARQVERNREDTGVQEETKTQESPLKYPSRYLTSPILAFVEVKTRSSGNWDADGLLAITPQKQAKLWQAAQLFLTQHPDLVNLPCRFDVALVRCQRLSRRSVCDRIDSSPSLIQLGQPLLRSGYQLILQDYIPSAFEGA